MARLTSGPARLINDRMKRRSRSLKQASSCADKLKVLADPTRLAVIESLKGGAQHVGTLMKNLNVEQTLMSHHLKALRAAGLVVSERDGKAVLYRLAASV